MWRGGVPVRGRDPPAELMKVDVNVVDQPEVQGQLREVCPAVSPHMLCAADTNRDSCSGDSSGPMVQLSPGGQCTQVGIVSWGLVRQGAVPRRLHQDHLHAPLD